MVLPRGDDERRRRVAIFCFQEVKQEKKGKNLGDECTRRFLPFLPPNACAPPQSVLVAPLSRVLFC